MDNRMNDDELVLFLSFCRKIREWGDKYSGSNICNYTCHISNINNGNDFSIRKRYGVAYSLQRKGFLKINKKGIASMDSRGIEYVNYLKAKLNSKK